MQSRRPSTDRRSSDNALLELLRKEGGLGIGELSSRLGVTATAIRQRLDRLMRAGLIGRAVLPAKLRGRPSHLYSLTEAGRKTAGNNFRDLALVLWGEIRRVDDPSVRRGLVARIGAALAGLYEDEVTGTTPCERLASTAKILQQREISCSVEPAVDGQAVLTSHSCPYPDLAESDRGICAAERIMLEQLVGDSVRLSECRLDGSPCCRFTIAPGACIPTG
jgi:DeoR family suf operon transcriptional repressor